MDFRDYLSLATTLVNEATEAEWRSAVSRAYYAAFHVARELLLGLSFPERFPLLPPGKQEENLMIELTTAPERRKS